MNHGHVNDLTRSLVAAAKTRRAVMRFLANGALGGSAAVAGGLLWALYGVFEMVQPWGQDTAYRDELGYAVITDALLHWAYSLPGSLALLLTASSLLAVFGLLELRVGRTGRAGLVLAYTALALAVLSAVGVIGSFDPLFTAPRIFGTLALGAATWLAGLQVRRMGDASSRGIAFLALGLLGLFLLPLWPLVHALDLIPANGGAGVIALFGLGWALTGYRLRAGAGKVRYGRRGELMPGTWLSGSPHSARHADRRGAPPVG